MAVHALAGGAIPTFRRHISASNAGVEAILRETGTGGASPIPLRLCGWMTGFMAAGYIVSCFTRSSLPFTRRAPRVSAPAGSAAGAIPLPRARASA